MNADGNAVASDSEIETHTVPLAVLTEKIPDGWKKPLDLHKFPPANSAIRCAEKHGEGKTTVALLLWYKDGRGPQGPHYIRCVDVDSDEFIFHKEAAKKDNMDFNDGADLKEILNTGSASDRERIPDIKHPELR